ncbi:hypothetical protein H261_03938 [Paramagnetospirillum caucaseum]|uniref:Uncharacterized protein n=1 Tax=Paramagnetospirillum caucaseum TaxID=1244869 RepID=M2YEA4_9PROT|nr:hypothetical protein [Paramagnetospirillum caucaseum]EME71316.1 hypothetical protein H261_03938 [Paramagnetospirillum caucaseum]
MRPRALATVLLCLVALAGCKGDETGRQIKLDKGTYLGLRDGEIAPATRAALQQRIAGQSDGIARLTANGVIPTGEAAPSGRITGQKF